MQERALALGTAVLALSWASPPAEGQTRPVLIAILPFQDRGSYGGQKETFQALELGIPASLAGELGTHSELRLVDPARVSQAVAAEAGARAGRLDAATAARVGKRLGARYAVTGSFADFYGRFRLDARIIDVSSGQTLRVVSNTDPELQDRSDLYRIVQRVAHKILIMADPAAESRVQESEGPAIPTDAMVEFSLGLLAEQQGDEAKAARHYNEALSGFPDYPEARAALRRVRGR
jgi:TolB-like protein